MQRNQSVQGRPLHGRLKPRLTIVPRPDSVNTSSRRACGTRQEMACEGLLSTCVQHEIDHLDGVLFIDHISALKRNMILRKLLKARKEKEREEAEGKPADKPNKEPAPAL